MYRIAACDDNKVFLEILCRNLSKWAKIKSVNVEISTFYDGMDLWENIKEYGHYQIIFLEVEVGRPNGLSLAVTIAEQSAGTLIIFMSAFDRYFKPAYRVYPYYFFSKPIHKKELFSVMNHAIIKLELYDQDFRFYYKKVYYSILIREILYFFSEKRRICIVCRDKKSYWFYGRLDQIEEKMGEKAELFLRIHKSYFVNRRHIRMYHYKYVEMADREKLPISQSRRKAIRKRQEELVIDI